MSAVEFEELELTADDGVRLALRHVIGGSAEGPVALLLHGHGVSSDMFATEETRNLAEVLRDNGIDTYALDWRGSCRLPYNERGPRFTYDHVAAFDIPAAVRTVRERTGGRPLYVIAHCIGALALGASLTAGLVPGLAGVVAHGVFLTPRMSATARMRLGVGAELLRRAGPIPTDFRAVGLFSRRTPLFAALTVGAGRCPDPTCRIVHNAWGAGGELFLHDNLHPATHRRLADLAGPIPTWTLPHLRRAELAHTMVRFDDRDARFAALPASAVESADRIDCPVMLLAGSENRFWYDSNALCADVLAHRASSLDVRYREIPGYGHLDAFLGRGAAIDVFGHILEFLEET
ncbi:alpha/beta fold hydrolase [Tsukamurella sp. 8F]|uniref:alpha/beta hydrolase n=1 Tax=unclassified Tsukamurella TaxID=2633480 RepID=UPI0023B8C847|nr:MULTISPECIES: alpha/beta fold hydrolase [unclassified Tsukamurella]MDF0530797.1 alpha/beta fold hydrolase [Tsukamurella sp. 8J]MDF0588323.1 alpha/beta fold hydrolase [Tsukamurella sp. 8F]